LARDFGFHAPPDEEGRKGHLPVAEIVPLSTADRQTPVRRKSRQRSRIGNGSSILNGVDGRLIWPRRFKELFADHLSDTPDASVAERSSLRRACTLEVELERMETMFALAGEASPEAIDLYARCAANLRRLLESVSVGLQRRARDVTPDPLQFARSYQNGDGA
jgi:hypothetical protein